MIPWKKSLGAALLLVVLGSSPPGETASLPPGYPASFMESGTVQGVDHAHYTLIINALSYRYTAALKVHSLSHANDYTNRLQPGMKVGFSYTISGGRRILTEVWELPAQQALPTL